MPNNNTKQLERKTVNVQRANEKLDLHNVTTEKSQTIQSIKIQEGRSNKFARNIASGKAHTGSDKGVKLRAREKPLEIASLPIFEKHNSIEREKRT